jgi:hypothetical protein
LQALLLARPFPLAIVPSKSQHADLKDSAAAFAKVTDAMLEQVLVESKVERARMQRELGNL